VEAEGLVVWVANRRQQQQQQQQQQIDQLASLGNLPTHTKPTDEQQHQQQPQD
jgi:hypothetical protein